MSKFKIHHVTRYNYEVAVRDSANQIMLYPLKDDFQETLQHYIKITGDPMIDVYQDYYGNSIGTFTNTQPHKELIIDSTLVIVKTPQLLPIDTVAIEEQWKALEAQKFQVPFIDFLKTSRFEAFASVEALIKDWHPRDFTPLTAAKHFCSYVFENFRYKKGITTVESTLDEVWQIKSGVCQDFAHILLVMLRLMDIPARYVSGYICPEKNDMRGGGATHAWVEAYIPFYGWLGLDPTNNCIVNEFHVRLAVGKKFSDCSPVKGTYRGTSDHTLEVAVSVSYEDGHSSDESQETTFLPSESIANPSQNSFRRHQEMQMQQ